MTSRHWMVLAVLGAYALGIMLGRITAPTPLQEVIAPEAVVDAVAPATGSLAVAVVRNGDYVAESLTNGDASALQVDANGALWVHVVNPCEPPVKPPVTGSITYERGVVQP